MNIKLFASIAVFGVLSLFSLGVSANPQVIGVAPQNLNYGPVPMQYEQMPMDAAHGLPPMGPPFGNVYPQDFGQQVPFPPVGQYYAGGYNLNSLGLGGGFGGYPAGYGQYSGCSIPGFIAPGCYKVNNEPCNFAPPAPSCGCAHATPKPSCGCGRF